jgi:hypothetical protein
MQRESLLRENAVMSGRKRTFIGTSKSWLLVIIIAFSALFAVMRAYNLDSTWPGSRYSTHVIPIALSVLYYHWPYDYTGNRSVQGAIYGRRSALPSAIQEVVLHPEKYQDNQVISGERMTAARSTLR